MTLQGPAPGAGLDLEDVELVSARPCPAHPHYVELGFSASGGAFTWCFPTPLARPSEEPSPAVVIAVVPRGRSVEMWEGPGRWRRISRDEGVRALLDGARAKLARTRSITSR